MNCKKVQELILTDYLDNQMEAGEKLFLESHLARCADCREALAAARKVTDELFAGAQQLNPPDFLWQQVKKSIIAQESKRRSFVADFFARLRPVVYVRKPIFAVAVMIMLVLIAGTTITLRINGGAAVKSGQIEYSYYSMGEPVDQPVDDEADFGTSVEQYFL